MGHRDIQTTQIYADYAPDPSNGREWVRRAFASEDAGQSVAASPSLEAVAVTRFARSIRMANSVPSTKTRY